MPSADKPWPDDFPDLTLPDKAPREPEPVRDLAPRDLVPREQSAWPLERSAGGGWRVGDRVFAPWEPHFLYAGVIKQIQDNHALIAFGDGDSGWVELGQVRALAVKVGQAVLSRRRMGPVHYQAEVLEVRGERVLVEFADQRDEEWTTLAALRIPCQPTGPGASPVKFASHLTFTDNLAPGERVWAHWQGGVLFAGTVDQVGDDEAHIHFDDGDRGWVKLEQILPLDIPLGLRVMARWKMGSSWFAGTVDEVRGEQIHIQYDDGDREWTKPAALALPAQLGGPDARATKTAWRWGGLHSWLLPVIIGVMLVALRSGCR